MISETILVLCLTQLLFVKSQLPEISGKAKLILPSAKVNLDKDYIQLPLYKGFVQTAGRTENDNVIWHIITDTSSKYHAKRLNIVYSRRLGELVGTNAVRLGQWKDLHSTIMFNEGRVDFTLDRNIIT
eukprot:Pgem_evm1s9201